MLQLNCIITACILCTAFYSHLHAQELSAWERLHEFHMRDFYRVWHGDSVLALKAFPGSMYLSYDDGITWVRKDLNVSELHIGVDGVLVMLSDDRRILHSSNNGRSFRQVGEDLSIQNGGVDFLGKEDYVYLINHITNQYSRYYRSMNGGLSWEEFASPSMKIRDFTIGPDGSLYALSYENGDNILRYDVAGNEWVPVQVPLHPMRHIHFGRDGRLYGYTVEGALFRSEIGTTELAPYASEYRVNISTPLAVTSRGEIVVNMEGAEANRLSRISADGQNAIPLILKTQGSSAIPIIGANDVLWVLPVGSSRTPDRCYRVISSAAGDSAYPVEMQGAAHIWQIEAAPSAGALARTASQVFLIGDNGEIVHELNYPDSNSFGSRSVVFVDVATIYYSDGFLSSDYGITWRRIGNSVNTKVFRSENGFLFTYPDLGLHRSTDTGRTWIEAARQPVSILTGFKEHIYAVGPEALYSADSGSSWDTVSGRFGAQPQSVSTTTHSGTLIIGLGTIDTAVKRLPIYYTFRAGDTGKVSHVLPCDDSNTTYLFASDPVGRPYLAMTCGLFRSDDEGVSWKKIADMPQDLQPTALLINEAGTFFLGTNEGLFKAELISSVGSSATAGDASIAIQATPNPVANDMRIGFRLATASRVKVDLFDPIGRHMACIVEGDFSAGAHSVSWNVPGELAAGSYVLAIEANGESASQSILLIPD